MHANQMKISKIFGLSKSQAELDFVDTDPEKDKLLFIDPFLISNNTDEWSIKATHTIQSFFQFVLDNIRVGNENVARQAFRHLHEPNDTLLGMSVGRPRGRGVGSDNANDLFEAIKDSEAVKSGLVTDIQDTTLFIDNIGRDKISDMTTNIIRKHLTDYTVSQAEFWEFPLRSNTNSGFFWDEDSLDWKNELTNRLVIKNKPILLVPKSAVSFFTDYTAQNYHQHDALDFLKGDHLRRETYLVKTKTNKDGSVRKYVTKKDLKEKELPFNKDMLVSFSRRNPAVFEAFKARVKEISIPLQNEEIDNSINWNDLIDFLIEKLQSIPSGKETADEYHNFIKGITELVFYPNLVNPTKEAPINQGRKRIDILFRNAARDGFFEDISRHYSSNYVPIECKNYSEDHELSNPEFDQMTGRLAPSRGVFGIIICRTVKDQDLLLKRSQDAYKDDRKIVVYLTDEDLIKILKQKKEGSNHPEYALLQDKVDEIIIS